MKFDKMDFQNRVECSFISCSCSKTPHSADWDHQNGWIIFGSSHNVGLISPETPDKAAVIAGTYCEHEGDVTCVKWVKIEGHSENDPFAISGATNSRVILWRFNSKNFTLQKLGLGIGHSMTVTHVCGLKIDESILIASCSADSTLRIWICDSSKTNAAVEAIQTIDIERGGFALCADIRTLDKGIILASGNDDKKIHLYWKNDVRGTFVQAMTLSGHEDWIRGLSFQPADIHNGFEDSILLATCSQDSYVRIWRISVLSNETKAGGDSTNVEIRLKRQMFSVEKQKGESGTYSVGLDAVLAGHEDWVYSVQWHPAGKARLLTASMDKCVIMWEPDETSGLWIAKTRLGIVGGPVASGFYGGLFGPNATHVLGHSFQGGIHIWRETQDGWIPAVAPSGHFGVVEDIGWDPNGCYLLSCGVDQTTRLYGPWIRDDMKVTVHEISRPQVHGYDMQCLVSVSSSCFVSGAEEKTLRAFTSTKTFAENFTRITNANGDKATKLMSILCDPSSSGAVAASVPSLGLSNKALFVGEMNTTNGTVPTGIVDEEEIAAEVESTIPVQPVELKDPPTEDHLMQSTLWPEVHKLYGHGCEVFAVACNHAGTVIASAAKANKAEQAQVILWSTNDWQQWGQIGGHTLTITQIAFSPDDQYLLTVSRDRTWCLHQRQDNDFHWIRVGYTDKKTAIHARIIWSCSWSSDSRYFVTASRDKKVAMWKVTEQNSDTSTGIVQHVGSVLDAPDSATAVAICPRRIFGDSYLVAVGLESGQIILYRWSMVTKMFEKLYELNRSLAHALTVKRLRFRPLVASDWLSSTSDNRSNDLVYLASCSDDHSVKVYRIDLGSC